MRRYIVLILGAGGHAKKSLSAIRRSPYLELGVDYAELGKKNDILLEKGKEIRCIREGLSDDVIVVGVVNRVDEYIPLWGRLVDEFGVAGSGYEAVMKFKSKWSMHELMQEQGLGEYRPWAKGTPLERLTSELKDIDLPVVVKPVMGAKSRGVFVLRDRMGIKKVEDRLAEHFGSAKVKSTGVSEKIVLLEEFLGGTQHSLTCFVNREGELRSIGWVDIYTGNDLGANHSQLVYRTTDSSLSDVVKDAAEKLVQRLVEVSGLKSTFLHPEFILTEKGIKLVEMNVRLGGFRSNMSRLAYGLDVDSMVVDLALGKDVSAEKKDNKSCTGVEWWGEESGKISRLEIPEDDRIVDLKCNFAEGDFYEAPPMDQKPLARFFVVSKEDSLSVAKDVLARSSFGTIA